MNILRWIKSFKVVKEEKAKLADHMCKLADAVATSNSISVVTVSKVELIVNAVNQIKEEQRVYRATH